MFNLKGKVETPTLKVLHLPLIWEGGVGMGIAISLEILQNIPIGPDSPWLCLV